MFERRGSWLAVAATLLVACSSGSNSNGGRKVRPTGDGDSGNVESPNGGTGAIEGGQGDGDSGNTPVGPNGPMRPPPVLDPGAVAFVRDDRPGSLDQDMISKLDAGGPCKAPIIYPYAGTVFPGALTSPVLMWQGNTTAVSVSFKYDNLDSVDYKFGGGASNPGELKIPQDAWDEMTRRTRGTGLRATVNAMVDGAVSSCEVVMQIAPGNMVGSIYYNTYNAPGVMSPGNGAVMRLVLGPQSQADIYLQYQGLAVPVSGPCISCHSVSANGSTIVASTHDYAAQLFDVYSYNLTSAAQPPMAGAVPNSNFGALTPDGSRMLALGNPSCTAGSNSFPRSANNFPLVEGPSHARLLDTQTGTEIAATGLDPDHYMWMPQFSPNGDKVVFNHAQPDGKGGTDRRKLAIMDYDQATDTFSNLRVIVDGLGPAPSIDYAPGPTLGAPLFAGEGGCTDALPATDPFGVGAIPGGTCTGPCYPAYPFFTPDGKGVVFALTSEPDFASAVPGRTRPAKSELWYVNLTKDPLTPVPLTNLNTTMAASDAQHDYYPTVLPVAVGGYFWVFWTSRRAYGHRDHHQEPLLTPEEDPYLKRIWAAALRPSAGTAEVVDQVTDPSFPGFYLDGQSASGNVRAFATLNPCMDSGPSSQCTAGLDCCSGFCYIEQGQTVGMCTEEIPECAKTNEKCETDDDCCPPEDGEPQNICLGGFCNFVIVQ